MPLQFRFHNTMQNDISSTSCDVHSSASSSLSTVSGCVFCPAMLSIQDACDERGLMADFVSQNDVDNARVTSEDVARGSMSALQQLLSKIGSGIDEAGFVSLMAGTGMGGSKARFKEIINRLVTPESDAHLLTALEDLSTSLSMANEV